MNNDLISRSDLIEATAGYRCGLHGVRRESVEMIFEYIKHAPAVDAEPVRHGRWEHGMQCSFCKQIDTTKPNYCPSCGAKMDAQEE